MEDVDQVLKALGAFDYMAANKLIYKLNKIYQPIGSIFTRLCSCESSFTQLQFLRSRWFVMRKDTSVEVIYNNIANELPKEIIAITSSTLSNNDKNHLIVIMDSLSNLCSVRKDMINIYQGILAQSTKGEFDGILKDMESVKKRTASMHLDKQLNILGLGVEKEINILTNLLKARAAITDYAFQDACISLFQAKQDLTEWKRACTQQDYPEKTCQKLDIHQKEASFWGFFSHTAIDAKQQQGDSWPNTIRWAGRVLGNLTAKMTLYFNSILLEKESIISEEDPEKSLWKGLKIDYYDQISTFKRKHGAHHISLVYQVLSDTPFYPQGYACSNYAQPQGIHSFPFIYSYPRKDPPTSHLPNIISIIQDSKHKLNDPRAGPVQFLDHSIHSTYYMMRIDRHTVLVVIYQEAMEDPKRETMTIEFMNNIVITLRGSTMIEELIRVDQVV